MPKDIPVELNTREGTLWKQTAMQIQQSIEIGKINTELHEVTLEYCNKKVKEDQEKLKAEAQK